MRERGVGEVVAGEDDPTLGDRLPEQPDADGQVDRADPLAAAPAADPGVVREAEAAGGRVDQVDHRPVRIEEAGGLLHRGNEQLVHLAHAAVRISLARMVVGLRAPGCVDL